MRYLYLFSIWLHVVVAAIWIGGAVFLAAVLVPMIRRPEYRAQAPAILQWAGGRLRTIGWTSLAILVVTGVFNLVYRRFLWLDVDSPRGWGSPFGQILASKLTAVAVIVVLSLVHDVVVGPRATAAMRASPGSAEAHRLRKAAAWIGRGNLLLSLIVLALAVMLMRGLP